VGTGENAGQGGAGSGFGTRGTGERDAIDGHTKASERAVAAALFWLSRHQNRDGSWRLDHRACCKGGTCSGFGEIDADTGATALALLPFFAAGQTHQSKGPYQRHIEGGINWLIKNQKPNGDLSANTNPHNQMYCHGLAAIALCEAYGMTQDSRVGYAAQSAIDFRGAINMAIRTPTYP
jgi:prenyltransferase beta subunit